MYGIEAKAGAPSRSTGTVTLSWGLLTIPLSYYIGTEETKVARKEFFMGIPDRPVGRVMTDKATGTVIDSAQVTKMAEATSGTWVELTDDEIAACTLPKGLAEIVSFLPNKRDKGYIPEGTYAQLRPPKTKGKSNPAQEKAYCLLLAAMDDADVTALVKFSLRGAARFGILDTNGDLTVVRTSSEVREALPLPTVTLAPAERELAAKLIEAVGVGVPILEDDTAVAVQAYVDGKAAGHVAPTLPPPTPAVDDLLAMLHMSIADKEKDKVTA
jgi:non-homologous end joining protein Ku